MTSLSSYGLLTSDRQRRRVCVCRSSRPASSRSPPPGEPDGVEDVLIAGAAAEIAREELPDRVVGRVVVRLDAAERHDEAGGAEAALEPVALLERRLHR